jgi:excisionase family DNA binding protein
MFKKLRAALRSIDYGANPLAPLRPPVKRRGPYKTGNAKRTVSSFPGVGYLTVKEASELMRLSGSVVSKMVRDGVLRGELVRGRTKGTHGGPTKRWRIERASVSEWTSSAPHKRVNAAPMPDTAPVTRTSSEGIAYVSTMTASVLLNRARQTVTGWCRDGTLRGKRGERDGRSGKRPWLVERSSVERLKLRLESRGNGIAYNGPAPKVIEVPTDTPNKVIDDLLSALAGAEERLEKMKR